MNRSKLPPATRIGAVHLRVRDLTTQVAYYRESFGFSLLAEDGGTAALGPSDGARLLVLHEAPDAPPRGSGTTGLYHVAFRLPTRADLGALILRVHARRRSFVGFADHNVSEAVYLTDPEGNGLEFYVDRARDTWRSTDGEIFMTTERLDVPGLLSVAPGPATRLPTATDVGHIHLQVADLTAAEDFYVGRIGFEVTSRSFPGALFVAAGGYHHHVGLNVWGGADVPPPEGSLGLMSFDLFVPSPAAREGLAEGSGERALVDPDGNRIRIAGP